MEKAAAVGRRSVQTPAQNTAEYERNRLLAAARGQTETRTQDGGWAPPSSEKNYNYQNALTLLPSAFGSCVKVIERV